MIDPYGQNSFVSPHQNTSGLMQSATGHKAVLYIFSPRPFSPQVRRSLMYKFHDRFVNAASDMLHRGGPSPSKIRSLLADPSTYDVAMPCDVDNGITRMDYLGDNWTFLLIVNGETPRRPMMAAGFEDVKPASYFTETSMQDNRAVYYGYCMDEPVNQVTMSRGSPTVNPNARLIITHKTFVHQHTGWGPNGILTPRFDVVSNTDVIDPGILALISTRDLHKLTPDQLMRTSEASVDPFTHERMVTSLIGDLDKINPHQPAFGIPANLSEPRENLKQLMNGIAHANETAFAVSRIGPMSEANLNPDLGILGNQDFYTEALVDRFTNMLPGSEMGLRENEIINMDLIMRRYNPEIQPYIINRATQWDVMDQTIRSPANLFSAMVMQAAPVLLTSAGLAEVSLSYDSYYDAEIVYSVGHVASVAEVEKADALRAFLHMLKMNLFHIIKAARGDFQIQLSLQNSGMSHCTLNFRCDNEINTVPFEVPTIAGGLNSNLLGSVDLAAHNGEALAMFTDVLAGKEPQPPVADFDY